MFVIFSLLTINLIFLYFFKDLGEIRIDLSWDERIICSILSSLQRNYHSEIIDEILFSIRKTPVNNIKGTCRSKIKETKMYPDFCIISIGNVSIEYLLIYLTCDVSCEVYLDVKDKLNA
jgi:hypothetical protein